jgi:hypothetical protein
LSQAQPLALTIAEFTSFHQQLQVVVAVPAVVAAEAEAVAAPVAEDLVAVAVPEEMKERQTSTSSNSLS